MEGFLVKDSSKSGGQHPPIFFKPVDVSTEIASFIGRSSSGSVENRASRDKDFNWNFLTKNHTNEIIVFHHLTFDWKVERFTDVLWLDGATEGTITFSFIKSWVTGAPSNTVRISTKNGATQNGRITLTQNLNDKPELMTYSQSSNAGINASGTCCASTTVTCTIVDISFSRYIPDFDN